MRHDSLRACLFGGHRRPKDRPLALKQSTAPHKCVILLWCSIINGGFTSSGACVSPASGPPCVMPGNAVASEPANARWQACVQALRLQRVPCSPTFGREDGMSLWRGMVAWMWCVESLVVHAASAVVGTVPAGGVGGVRGAWLGTWPVVAGGRATGR